MRTSRRLAKWTIAISIAGLMMTAGIVLQTVKVPAHAQQSGSTRLTPAQLAKLQSMQGHFVLESEPARPELWKSIEAGTSWLDPAQARRTRAQLEQLLGPAPRLELALETDGAAPNLAIQEGRAKASAPATGEVRALLPKGSRADAAPLQLSQRLEGTALVRVVEGKGFRQERRFNLSADASRMTLEIRVSGPALQKPLSASYEYRRL